MVNNTNLAARGLTITSPHSREAAPTVTVYWEIHPHGQHEPTTAETRSPHKNTKIIIHFRHAKMKIFGFWGWRVPPFPTPQSGAPPTHHPFLGCAQRGNVKRRPKFSGVINTPEPHPPTPFGCFQKTTLGRKTIEKNNTSTVAGCALLWGVPPHTPALLSLLGGLPLYPPSRARSFGVAAVISVGKALIYPPPYRAEPHFFLNFSLRHTVDRLINVCCSCGGRDAAPPAPPRRLLSLCCFWCLWGRSFHSLTHLRAGRFHPPCVHVSFCGFLRNRREMCLRRRWKQKQEASPPPALLCHIFLNVMFCRVRIFVLSWLPCSVVLSK